MQDTDVLLFMNWLIRWMFAYVQRTSNYVKALDMLVLILYATFFFF